MVDRRRKRTRLLAGCLVAAIALAVASCGGDSGDETDDRSLDEQVGLDGASVDDRLAEAENTIRDCMADQGFDYVPVDPAEQQAELTGIRGLSAEEFEERFGYGITTLYEQRLQLDTSNPNTPIREALSESDRAAYDDTLHGNNPSATLDVAIDDGDFSQLGGCRRTAAEEVFGGPEALNFLETEVGAVEERALADPRMQEAIDAWAECMRDRGYSYTFPEEIDLDLAERLDAIVGPPGDPNPDYDPEALRALQQEEVEVVTADIECEEEHIEAVEERVLAEYEREFREQHADELSRFSNR